jgi:hypothetical protein
MFCACHTIKNSIAVKIQNSVERNDTDHPPFHLDKLFTGVSESAQPTILYNVKNLITVKCKK